MREKEERSFKEGFHSAEAILITREIIKKREKVVHQKTRTQASPAVVSGVSEKRNGVRKKRIEKRFPRALPVDQCIIGLYKLEKGRGTQRIMRGELSVN